MSSQFGGRYPPMVFRADLLLELPLTLCSMSSMMVDESSDTTITSPGCRK